jgi:hypothetical protein
MQGMLMFVVMHCSFFVAGRAQYRLLHILGCAE